MLPGCDQMLALVGAHAERHFYAGFPQTFNASATDIRVRVAATDHHSGDARIDNGVHAWRRPALVTTRLQGNVQCRPFRLVPRLYQCGSLSVVRTDLAVVPLSDDLAIEDHDRTRVGIRRRIAIAPCLERESHPFGVVG